jgi:hypothetical protein
MTEVTAGIEAGEVVLAGASAVAGVKPGGRLRTSFESLPDATAASASRRELPASFD